MLKRINHIFIILLLPLSLLAKPSSQPTLLETILKKYSSSEFVEFDLEKQLMLSLLNKVKKQPGKLYIAGADKLKLQLDDPKSMAILNGQQVWAVDYPTDSSSKIHVIKTRIQKKSQSQVFLTHLLGKGNFLKFFKINKETKDKDLYTIELTAINPNDQFTKVLLKLDPNSKLITELSYWDALDNETKFLFKKTEFKKLVNKNLFDFEIPKDAEVVEETL